ncbi:hypothetical protein BKI52_13190 [marine bacterium AO1-C]|nr:hypothetical protein BKI52_13190 [marine bacterium AO1-C]
MKKWLVIAILSIVTGFILGQNDPKAAFEIVFIIAGALAIGLLFFIVGSVTDNDSFRNIGGMIILASILLSASTMVGSTF